MPGHAHVGALREPPPSQGASSPARRTSSRPACPDEPGSLEMTITLYFVYLTAHTSTAGPHTSQHCHT